MLSPRLPALLFATYSALCLGQSAAHYTVTGTVVNFATGEPIRRALVAVGGALVFTGADGRFEANNVPEGQTMIAAQKPGYFDCTHVECGGITARAQVLVTVRSDSGDVLLKLVPEASIQGRVINEDGEPISNVQVMVTSEHVDGGRKQLRPDGAASTDESGTYRIERLMPGSYTIATAPRPAFFFFANSDNLPPQMYPRQFYPNASDLSAAQAVDLKAGQVVDADFKLTPVPAFHIAGSIAPVTGGISLTAEDSRGQEMPLQLQLRPGANKFVVPYVPPGTWTLHFGEQTNEGQQYYAEASVTVTSKNIDNLQIALQPLASVTVNIANGSSEDPQMAQLTLLSRDSNSPIYGGNPQASPYVISNVHPGRYGVLVFGSNHCVDSVMSGSVDLTRDDLVIAPGSQPQAINVTLRSDCASLVVSPRSEDQAAKSIILLIPSSHAMAPIIIEAEPGGSGTFSNLSPGDYQVYAFSNIEGLEYTNPEIMRQFSGQEITLAPNQHANITLGVISRDAK